MMNNANMNVCKAVVDTRATRSIDAKIVLGELEITFHKGTIKMSASTYIRESNKNEFIEMENVLHTYIGEPINAQTMQSLADKLEPIANRVRIF